MRITTASSTSLICLLIAAAVLASGAHVKEIATFSLPVLWLDAQKTTDDQQHIVKVTAEFLHDHADKSIKVQTATGDGNQQTDTRSLRLLHARKKIRLWRA